MAWLAVDKDGVECICDGYPVKGTMWWDDNNRVELPKGTIKKLIGRELTWDDEPIELK